MRSRQLITAIAVLTLALLWGCSGSPMGPVNAPESASVDGQDDWALSAIRPPATNVDTTTIPNLPKAKGGTKDTLEFDFTILGGTSGASNTALLRRTSGALLNLKAKKTVQPLLGGVLINRDASVVVPPGALSLRMQYSILIPNEGYLLYELGPHGSVFNVPVTLTVSYANADLSGRDESTIRIAYLNPSTGQWEAVDSVRDPVLKTVTAQLQHFSTYGLLSDAKSTTTTTKGWPR